MDRNTQGYLQKKRRVLHVLGTAEPGGAAITRMVTDLGQNLDSERYQIEACYLEAGPLGQRFQALGLTAICLDWNGSPFNLPGAMRYAALLRSREFHIIHQHTGGRFLTAMGKMLTNARMVRTLHGRASEVTGQVAPELRLPSYDVLLANSNSVASYAKTQKSLVVYPGIDMARLQIQQPTHQGIVVGAACRLELIKGIRYLIEAMPRLIQEFPDLRLEIAGEGSLRKTLEEQSSKLGVATRVRFLGWRSDVPAVMQDWDIFVAPSLDEGFCISVLEAMATGLPVVASSVGGLPELVLDGETGWLIPEAESSQIAIKVGQLVRDKSMRTSMGTAGRRRALNTFGVERMVAQIKEVYDRLLS